MKFTFKDITNKEVYDTAKVLFVVGPYNIFNNIAIDAVKDLCKPSFSYKGYHSTGLLKGLDPSELESISISNVVDINTFPHVLSTIGVSGKWFCSVDYTFLTKKQKSWLDGYIKNPADTAKLVVYCHNFKDYRNLLKSKVLINSLNAHILQLSFPYRQALESVVKMLFTQREVNIEQKAIELFIMRMSNSYDSYEETIDKIIVESVPKDTSTAIDPKWKYTITYNDTLSAMKGIENFVLDDFLERLLIPLNSDKTNGKNKIYRMLSALLEEMGPQQLVNKLKYKIDDYIEFRLAINSGIIPVIAKFSVIEAKERLGENSSLSKFSDYTFRRMAKIAGKTSLRDWVYMKMILSTASFKRGQESYEKALYSLINRSVLTESRLNNDIGIENIMTVDLDRLDKIKYDKSEEVV